MKLFDLLSEEHQKKVTEHFNSKGKFLNQLSKFSSYEYAADVDIYCATEVFWAIYPTKLFNLQMYLNLFKK